MHPSSLAHPPYYIFPVFTTFTTNRLLPSRFRSQRAQCSSSLTFPRVTHSCAALATRARHIPDLGSHSCEVTCHAEACATVSDHFRPPNPAGLHVAHHFCSRACHTHVWSTRLDTNTPAIAPALYTMPRAPQRPTRLLAPLHTPTNPAHLRHVP